LFESVLAQIKGMQVDKTTKRQTRTALHFAATNGHFEDVRILSNHHSDLLLCDTNDDIALMMSIQSGQLRLFSFLLYQTPTSILLSKLKVFKFHSIIIIIIIIIIIQNDQFGRLFQFSNFCLLLNHDLMIIENESRKTIERRE
jgi:hypothetical protein